MTKLGPAITPAQSRAARGLLGWTQVEAHRHLGVGLSLLVTFEVGKSTPHLKNLAKISSGYLARGVRFERDGRREIVSLAVSLDRSFNVTEADMPDPEFSGRVSQ